MTVKALLDSGASRSLIFTKALNKLHISSFQLQESKLETYGVNGTAVRFLGKISLTIQLSTASIPIVFHAWDNSQHDIILGQDTFEKLYPITFTGKKFVFHFGLPRRSH